MGAKQTYGMWLDMHLWPAYAEGAGRKCDLLPAGLPKPEAVKLYSCLNMSMKRMSPEFATMRIRYELDPACGWMYWIEEKPLAPVDAYFQQITKEPDNG